MAFNGYTIDHVTLAALDSFEANCVSLRTCSRKVEGLFGQQGMKRGDTIRVRKPAQFTIRTGTAWIGQNINEQYENLVLNYQIGVDGEMSSAERKLELNSLTNQVIKPIAIRVANEVDRIVLRDVARRTYNQTGTYGTTPTAMSTYLTARGRMSDMTAPRGRGQLHMMINPAMEATVTTAITAGQNSLGPYVNPATAVGDLYSNADMDGVYSHGMNFHMDQNLYVHTFGTRGTDTVLTSAASAEGATTLATDGWTGTNGLLEGDRFTIASVFAVNPITKTAYPWLQPFVVTADGNSASGALTISISPTIRASGQFQNVSALPANDATLTFAGGSAAVATCGALWHKEAVTLAIVPLDKPDGVNQASTKSDPTSGVSMRYIEWYDGDTDMWKFRTDVLFGVLLQRAEHAITVYAE